MEHASPTGLTVSLPQGGLLESSSVLWDRAFSLCCLRAPRSSWMDGDTLFPSTGGFQASACWIPSAMGWQGNSRVQHQDGSTGTQELPCPSV